MNRVRSLWHSGSSRRGRSIIIAAGTTFFAVTAGVKLMAGKWETFNFSQQNGNPLVSCVSNFFCKLKADSNNDIGEKSDTSSDNIDFPRGLVLKKALVVFRHGARTPICLIPKIEQAEYPANIFMTGMPFSSFDYNVINEQTGGPRPFSQLEVIYASLILKGGSVSGQLTSLGHHQTYTLGLALRKDYIDKHKLINGELNKEEVFFKSTNTNRTILSLCCVLAGLFGSESLRKMGPLNIPVVDEVNEVLMPISSICPNLLEYQLQMLRKAESVSGMLGDRLKVEKSIGIDSSLNNKDRINWIGARDDLRARQIHGLYIPKELKQHMEVIKKNALLLLYNSLCGQSSEDNQVTATLSCGKAIDLFLQHLKSDTKDGKYKLYLYSCHDTSLTALLGALDIFDYKWPPFAADLRIELYEDENQKKYIKVSYLNKDVIPRGCNAIYSPFEMFEKGISPMAVNFQAHTTVCNCSEIKKKVAGTSTENSNNSNIKPVGL